MSAEVLRRAAADMRAKAEAATPGPWEFNAMDQLHEDSAGWVGHDRTGDGFQEFICATANHVDGFGDGAHIASWHPAVALAVADLIDYHVDRIEQSGFVGSLHAHLMVLARTYLGEQS